MGDVLKMTDSIGSLMQDELVEVLSLSGKRVTVESLANESNTRGSEEIVNELNMELPEEGMMFYEIEGEEKNSMWTVLSPSASNQKKKKPFLAKCWLSNEELKSFVEFEWEDEESHLRQLFPQDRGLPCELMSALWTENAEENSDGFCVPRKHMEQRYSKEV